MEAGGDRIIALDIGGTFIKYGVYTVKCEKIFADKEATKVDEGSFFLQICKIIDRLMEDFDGIAGIGISVPGFVDPESGENTDFSIPKGITSHNLKKELMEKYGCRVSIENDGNCAAIAERDFGEGKDLSSFVMVTVGTGIGGAIVYDKKLLRGKNFKAGELGFFVLGSEKEIGATSVLVERVSRRLGKKVDGEYVISHVTEPSVKDIYQEWLSSLAMVIGNTAAVLDPQKVLVGGGISANPLFIDGLRERVFELFPFKDYMEIVPCHFRNDAGKIGAVGVFLEEYGCSL